MLNRSNLILAVLLLIQLALLGIAAISAARLEPARTEPLLTAFSTEAVERITVADDLGNEVSLAKNEEGWVLPNADDFPVDAAKVEELLDKIAGLNTSRLIASNPSSLARLEVKDSDFQRRLNLTSASSTEVIYLGGSGGANATYVRRADDDRVYLGMGLNTWEAPTQVSLWIDTSYVNVPQDDIFALRLDNSHGSFSFQRDGEAWFYDGADEAVDEVQMASLLRNAASIHMAAPLGRQARDEYGLDNPQITLRVWHRQAVETADEATDDESDQAAEAQVEYTETSYALTVGAEQPDGNFALKSSTNDYIALARPAVVNAFADVSHETLMPPAEEPAP